MSETTTSNPESGESGVVPVDDVVRGFLSHYNFLHEFRLQKLVYLADVIYKIASGDRLTNADFTPYMYGSYSEDLHKTLEELEKNEAIPTEPDWQYGKTVTKFLGEKNPKVNSESSPYKIDGGLDRPERELIEGIFQALEGVSSEDLGKWSKDTYLYENGDFGEDMPFEDLNVEKNKNQVKQELKELSPDFEELVRKIEQEFQSS